MNIFMEIAGNVFGYYKKIRYKFFEKPKGLDFSLSDKSIEEENAHAHYYSCTDPVTLRKIKNYIKKRMKFQSIAFLDIGCGKGLVLNFFSRYHFGKLDGLDCSRKYCDIAMENLRIQNVENVGVFCSDATEFESYANYNVFFMYNPFSEQVMRKTLDTIYNNANVTDDAILIYVFPIFHSVVVEGEKYQLVKKLYSPLTMKYTYIYKMNR